MSCVPEDDDFYVDLEAVYEYEDCPPPRYSSTQLNEYYESGSPSKVELERKRSMVLEAASKGETVARRRKILKVLAMVVAVILLVVGLIAGWMMLLGGTEKGSEVPPAEILGPGEGIGGADGPNMPYRGVCEKDVVIGTSWRYDLEYYGQPSEIETCIDACSYNADCQFFVWLGPHASRTNACWLKTSQGQNFTEFGRRYELGAVSGKPGCKPPPHPVCEYDKQILGGNNIKNLKSIEGPGECRRRCKSTHGCHYWTWMATLDRTCSLWGTGGEDFLLLNRRMVVGAISGLWDCYF